MNKRQAKKAFKKQYGFTPGDLEKLLPALCDQIKNIIPALQKVLNDYSNSLHDEKSI